eukprot:CAMPEP_0113846230 /NCGR_PEP_ID=MMETSP0372-20130328/1194_1 /TAXON_ID=340204 /ORGANISM="Lankesteria abbotti" /LENGTH=162 /DNA_ID=CAMNT_0000815355 /DNA_START=193 /DNA_END=681 /DNA_ORIENTATION=+ /assembly_acc=CAM_ASM_000359
MENTTRKGFQFVADVDLQDFNELDGVLNSGTSPDCSPKTHLLSSSLESEPSSPPDIRRAGLSVGTHEVFHLSPKVANVDTKECDTKECDTKECDTKECDTKECDTKECDTKNAVTKTGRFGSVASGFARVAAVASLLCWAFVVFLCLERRFRTAYYPAQDIS